MLTTIGWMTAGVIIGWAARAARTEADLRQGIISGPRATVTRGKTGPDHMDTPAIWR